MPLLSSVPGRQPNLPRSGIVMMLLRAVVLLLACAVVLPALSAAADDVPLGRLPRSVVPEKYTVQLRMDPDSAGFSGSAFIDVDVREATDVIWLHGRRLDIERAVVRTPDGEVVPLKAEVADADGGVMKFSAPLKLAVGKGRIEIEYRARYDQQLQGAYQVKLGDDAYVMTQMEPLGARSVFPGFDEPAFKTPWDISLVVPEGQTAIANTAMVGIDKIEDGWRKLRFATTEKLPSYLIAFAVGPWDVVEWADIPPNAVRSTPLKLRGIAARGRGKEMTYALENTAIIVAALEAYFDVPYPFDKLDLLAAPDFSFGAMENAGLIVYRDSLLLGVEKAPTQLRQAYWGTHAHELAHQWFGNLVTMPWWDDVWLNEAFATWMASKIVHQLKPEFHADRRLLQSSIEAMTGDSLASTRRIHEPVHDYTDVLSAFDGITYQKGGAVLSMFESFLGEEKFRTGVRAHMRQFARGTATSADLMRSLSSQSSDGASLQAAFASFTDQTGVPFLRTRLLCRNDQATLQIRQHRFLPLGSRAPDSQSWNIPVCLRYAVGDELRKQCSVIEGASSEIRIEGKGCPSWVHPNADGAGYYRFALDARDQPALDAAFPRLNEREQRAYADSLGAAFRNGSLDAAGFLAAVPRLVRSEAREVVTAPISTLEWMRAHGVTDTAEREALQRWIVSVYGPRLAMLGLDARADDSDETRLLRQNLVALLATTARDAALRSELAARGRRVLGVGGDGKLALDAIASDQRAIALEMASRLGGETEFEALLAQFRVANEASLRVQLLAALGAASTPALGAKARALVFDPAVKSGEFASILLPQLEEPETRAAARAWLRENFDAVFAKSPQVRQKNLPTIDAIGMCSEDEAVQLHALYHQRMAKLEGGPRAMAQNEEGIRLCAALAAKQREVGYGEALRQE
jgi:alanyl aminopeptidase